jgi:hypothetical protein
MNDDIEEEKRKKENQRLYERTREELITSQRSNSENYDKSILTLSSAALGISITFISTVIELRYAIYKGLLFLSLAFFCFAIINTIYSFIISQTGIKFELKRAEKYYLKNVDRVISTKNKYAKYVDCQNIASGILFVFGIISFLVFMYININMENYNMKEEQKIQNEVNFSGQEKQRGMPINPQQPKPKAPSTTSNPGKQQPQKSGNTGDKGQNNK